MKPTKKRVQEGGRRNAKPKVSMQRPERMVDRPKATASDTAEMMQAKMDAYDLGRSEQIELGDKDRTEVLALLRAAQGEPDQTLAQLFRLATPLRGLFQERLDGLLAVLSDEFLLRVRRYLYEHRYGTASRMFDASRVVKTRLRAKARALRAADRALRDRDPAEYVLLWTYARTLNMDIDTELAYAPNNLAQLADLYDNAAETPGRRGRPIATTDVLLVARVADAAVQLCLLSPDRIRYSRFGDLARKVLELAGLGIQDVHTIVESAAALVADPPPAK